LKFLGQVLPDVSANELRTIAEKLRADLPGGVVTLIGVAEGKGSAIVAADAALKDKVDAVALVKAAAVAMGGQGGGGKPDFAQAGGPDGARAKAAVDAVRKLLAAR
jgi:alanyl-tRNA synthetase